MPSRQVCAALSSHPLAAAAVGEVVGEVLELKGDAPDLALVFLTESHQPHFEQIEATIRSLLRPEVLITATARGVFGDGQAILGGAGVALWTSRLGGVRPILATNADDLSLFLRTAPDANADATLAPHPDDAGTSGSKGPGSITLFAVDGSTNHTALLRALTMPTHGGDGHTAGPDVSGGFTTTGRAPGFTRLAVNGHVIDRGAVGFWTPPTVPTQNRFVSAWRAVGRPFTVTSVERHAIYELGGRTALSRVTEMSAELELDELSLLRDGLGLGIGPDNHPTELGADDWLVRAVLGADRRTGAIALDFEVPLGASVQFHLRLEHPQPDRPEAAWLAGAADRGEGVLAFASDPAAEIRATPSAARWDLAVIAELAASTRAPIAGMTMNGLFRRWNNEVMVEERGVSSAFFGE